MSSLQSASPEAAHDATSPSVDAPDFRGFTPNEVLDKLDRAQSAGKIPRDLGEVAAKALQVGDSEDAALILHLMRILPPHADPEASDDKLMDQLPLTVPSGQSRAGVLKPVFAPDQAPELTRDAVNKILLKAGVPTILPPHSRDMDVNGALSALAEESRYNWLLEQSAGTPLSDQPEPRSHRPRHKRTLFK